MVAFLYLLFCEYWLSGIPNVAKAGGLQRQGAEGEAVMILPRALGNAVSEVLRLSRKGRKDASIIVA